MTTTGYLLIGHGTRSQSGQDQFRQVHRQFAKLMQAPFASDSVVSDSSSAEHPFQVGPRVELAFLELAEPSIEQAMQRLAEAGVTQLVSVPLLLFRAGHADEDVPQAVQRAASECQIVSLGQSAPLELSREILQLSAERFRQAVCQPDAKRLEGCFKEAADGMQENPSYSCAACAETFCDRSYCERVALVMVGRGSSSAEASEAMREFARRRRQLTPVKRLETAFVHAQRPSVAEALELVARDGTCPWIVVQPHLLFEGQVLDGICSEVTEFAKNFPNFKWVVTRPLGTDFASGNSKLAKCLVKLASAVAAPG